MSPETKLLIIAGAIATLGAWWGWYIHQPDKPLPPPSKDVERKHDVGFWS